MNNYTLHKLTKEGFIITSDQEIKKGDLKYDIVTKKIEICDYDGKFRDWKKVIAQQDQITFSEIIPKEKLNEIGWLDVEKLAFEFEKLQGNSYNNEIDFFIGGFQKAQEIEYKNNLHEILSDFYIFATNGEVCKHEVINDYIQSLSQLNKSWQVELEMEWHNQKTKETSRNEFNIRNFKDKNDFVPQPKLINNKIKILRIL